MVTKPCLSCDRLMDADYDFCTTLCNLAYRKSQRTYGIYPSKLALQHLLEDAGVIREGMSDNTWLSVPIWDNDLGPLLRCQSCKGDFHAKTMGHRFCSKICKKADYEVRKGREPSQRTARRRLLGREAERHGNHHENV